MDMVGEVGGGDALMVAVEEGGRGSRRSWTTVICLRGNHVARKLEMVEQLFVSQ